jgi:hypothetical protein
MTEQILNFVAVTTGGRGFDIGFPLHPETQSGESVSELVTALLATISAQAGRSERLSDGDILQALAMTAAIRGRMIDAGPGQIDALMQSLHAVAWEAVQAATSYQAARA